MKSFPLFLSLIVALGAAVELPLEEQTARDVTESRSLRRSRDPMEMSPKESVREAVNLCQILNTVVPANVMPCTCADQAINGIFNFECTAAQPRCIAAGLLGSVCTRTRISGNLLLQFFQQKSVVAIRACGVQNSIQATAPGSSYPIADVCAHVNVTLGVAGTGVSSCGVALGNRTCNSCFVCKRGNSTGIGFSCGEPITFCLPINLPIFVDKPALKGATLEQVMNLKAWDDAAMALVTMAAQQKQPPPPKKKGN